MFCASFSFERRLRRLQQGTETNLVAMFGSQPGMKRHIKDLGSLH